jgi:arylsulfatase A-like enzyme
MTDNGTASGRRVFNAGMRGAKGSVSQGGTRAASFWRWPGTLLPADVKPLTAHIDVFATLAELAGATLSEEVQQQVEGLSLVPLLLNPDAAWPDRMLVTHGGRWEKGEPPRKSRSWRVRNSRYCLVSRDDLQLYDLQADPRESRDVAGEHPEIVREFVAAYDKWWDEVVPLLVNEDAWRAAPAVNPFREQYEKTK